MKEKFIYQYNPEEHILYKYYYGPISIEDIKSSWLHAIENGMIPKETKGFILDYRKAKFNMKIREHDEIAEFYRNNLAVFRNKRIGIISDNPKTVVVIMLVEAKDEGYSSKPFATIEAAKSWVLYG